ncbi:MAG: NAD-dependent epimerase/dehydratase family protein [Alphaproteobacteria bacterium]|nr:NAD-dependent epimerase/dehydratase family protein [Alphaproteobacteria bacterium]MBV9062360.1 NAD-dependent epimerase/dehydratase family protein [Alphaproteobacteria bacterium]
MADLVLVTGATGFVGSAVARKSIERGFRVRALVRPSSRRKNLDGLNCEIAEGDLREPASLAPATDGVRYVFHVAADYRLWARDPSEIIRNNRDGTKAMMEAAATAGVERVVYTSSVATLTPREDGSDADENDRAEKESAIGAYKQSKVVAEQVVAEMAAQGLPAIIVSPSTPIGPRDIRPTPTGRIIVEAARGHMPAYVETGLNLVHVDDVADGHLLALEKGRIGENYILGGHNVMLKDMLGEVARLTGRKPPRLGLPHAPLYPLAWVSERFAGITGKEPMLTLDALKMSKHKMFFSSAKARRELGYALRPWRLAVADAVNWFKVAGYLP